MATPIRLSITLASAIVLHLAASNRAIAQTDSPIASPSEATVTQPSSSTSAVEAQPLEPNAQAVPTPEEAIPVCLDNQFASVFPDVRPDHWAFEAVNRLAIGESRCFPNAPQS